MTKEYSPSTPENPYQKFGFTESEILFNRITHKRFLEMLKDPKSKIHTIEESGNAYGEFLFVTVSRENNGQQLITTFYGLGFHGDRGQGTAFKAQSLRTKAERYNQSNSFRLRTPKGVAHALRGVRSVWF